MRHNPESHDERALQRRGLTLLGVAGAAAAGVLLVALASPAHDGLAERMLLDTAPAAATMPAERLAALDDGLDWSRVERAGEHAQAAVAAYEH
jgi:hypothetical protein